MLAPQLLKKAANRRRGDVGVVGHSDHFAGMAVECPEDVVALASRCSPHEDAGKTPEHTHPRSHHEMRGVDEEDFPPSRLGLIELWAQFAVQEFELELPVGFARETVLSVTLSEVAIILRGTAS